MPPPLLQLVSNPQSGSYDDSIVAALDEALSGAGYVVQRAISAANCPFIPDEAAAHVCVAGGDGTVRHVAESLVQLTNPPGLSVYPMGTINLVAREWQAPRNPEAFARHVAYDIAQRGLNVVTINGTCFAACASIGPDSSAVAGVSHRLKAVIGRAAYGVSLARVLIGWSPPKLTVVIDGNAYSCGAVYLANGRYFAGPWVLAPDASLADNALQVILLNRARRIDFVIFALAVILGRVASLANVQIILAHAVTITADRPVQVQLDGDIGAALPASIAVHSVRLSG
jgi:diacylglycerol kinase (ATP)